VTPSSVIISMTVFTVLYATLAAIAGRLAVRHVKAGAAEDTQAGRPDSQLPVFSY
jgi:cytochrome bd ubiquinol oxidase subunit I